MVREQTPTVKEGVVDAGSVLQQKLENKEDTIGDGKDRPVIDVTVTVRGGHTDEELMGSARFALTGREDDDTHNLAMEISSEIQNILEDKSCVSVGAGRDGIFNAQYSNEK